VVLLPHNFDSQQLRFVAVFTDDLEEQMALEKNSAVKMVGGAEVVKQAKTSKLSFDDFDYVIVKANMLEAITPLRTLMKTKFPTINSGTVVADVIASVQKFTGGVRYLATKDQFDYDFGKISVPVGNLEMPDEHISANIEAMLTDINTHKNYARGEYDFITAVRLHSPPVKEMTLLETGPFQKCLDAKPEPPKRRGRRVEMEEIKVEQEPEQAAG